MKKVKEIILISVFLCLFISINVEAKEVKTSCDYTLSYGLYKTGKTFEPGSAYDGGTISLKIYDDLSQDGKAEGNGSFFSENFGQKEKITNWGKSVKGVPDIKGEKCPDYIGVIVTGLTDRQWYGFTEETIKDNYETVVDADNNDSMFVFILNEKKDNEFFTCKYDDFSIFFNKDDYKVMTVGSNRVNPTMPYTYVVKQDIKLKDTNNNLVCPVVYVHYYSSPGGNAMYGDIYYDKMSLIADHKDGRGEEKICKEGEYCNPQSRDSYTCSAYTNRLEEIIENKKMYKSTGKIIYLNNVKQISNNLKVLCNSVMSSADYNDTCLLKCLGITDDLADDSFEYNEKCGISERLKSWILNIIKWIKYILPVGVIILGVLDFIKAMGAEKDDEMKKAQSKFIKRLIAAALVFIVPLIIEFILEKMGFSANSCGLWK